MPYQWVFSKFMNCICRNFKPHKLGLSKSLKLKQFLVLSFKLIYFVRLCFNKQTKNLMVIKNQWSLEGE